MIDEDVDMFYVCQLDPDVSVLASLTRDHGSMLLTSLSTTKSTVWSIFVFHSAWSRGQTSREGKTR